MEVVQLYKDKAKTQEIAPITDVKAVFNNGVGIDYVVETITVDGWTCRKWESGFLECFGKFTISVTWGGAGFINCVQNTPSIMTTMTSANVNVAVGGIVGVYVAYTNPTTSIIDIWVYCPQATSNNPTLSISAYGRWK